MSIKKLRRLILSKTQSSTPDHFTTVRVLNINNRKVDGQTVATMLHVSVIVLTNVRIAYIHLV